MWPPFPDASQIVACAAQLPEPSCEPAAALYGSLAPALSRPMASRWRDPVSSQIRKRLRFWHSYPKSRIAVSAASPGKPKNLTRFWPALGKISVWPAPPLVPALSIRACTPTRTCEPAPLCRPSPRSPNFARRSKFQGRGPLRSLVRVLAFYPLADFYSFVCASRPEPVKQEDPVGVRGGGLPCGCRSAPVFAASSLFGLASEPAQSAEVLCRLSAGFLGFSCPSFAHTHDAATRETRNFPKVLDPHE